jgi:hypothetical protein
MPFGKYKNWLIRDLPLDYLLWVTSIELRQPLRGAIDDEVRRRQDETEDEDEFEPEARRGRQPDRNMVERIVDCGMKTLARRHHPDVGGDHRTMVAILAAADWLKQIARRALAA